MSTRRSKQKKRGGKRQQTAVFSRQVKTMPNYREAIAPPRERVQFRYTALGVMAAAAGSFSKRWLMNSAYAPQVGTAGSVQGFSLWSAIYAYYRVTHFSYRVTIVNNMAEAVAAGVYLGSADPGTSATMNTCQQPLGKSYLLSTVGGQDRHTFRGGVSLTEIYGEPNIDDNFAATVAASPADLAYFAIILQSSSGANLTAGCSYEIELKYFVEFYTRNRFA